MNVIRLLSLFTILAATALAQPMPSPTPGSGGPPIPVPQPSGPPPTAAKLALAHEVITAMRADRMFDNIATQMKRMSAQMMGQPSEDTPEKHKKSEELQGKIADLASSAAKSLIGQLDQIYAEVYSDAELNAMKAFFTSPEAQSMMAKQPQVMGHVMPMVQAMQRQLIPQMQKLVEEAKGSPATLPVNGPSPAAGPSPSVGPDASPAPTPSNGPGPQPMPPSPTTK